ncbi:MAG TPA: hypothetical protein VLD67_18345 [Vicinamibacterales bacterium]|nr:hypothetical protein [Vicinamibacterales bacterium]
MVHAVTAALVLGALSTSGDFLWETLQLRHRVVTGLAHGAVICLFIGLAVGARERKPLAGLAAGPVVGVLAAGGFYILAPWLRWLAMLPAWMFFWLCFATLQWRLRGRDSIRAAIVRGLLAAVLSGLAFWSISGIWTEHAPGGPDYLRNFLSWTFAFLPGFAALFAGRREMGDGQRAMGNGR